MFVRLVAGCSHRAPVGGASSAAHSTYDTGVSRPVRIPDWRVPYFESSRASINVRRAGMGSLSARALSFLNIFFLSQFVPAFQIP